jgi:hypothetical protein
MPLRNERQAYWDDIDRNIARVDPLTASQALDRVCPEAAAERLRLKSRLREVEAETRQVQRLRQRAASEANVLARETDAMLNLEAKETAAAEARRFVRGRLENDRPDGQRLGMRAPELAARASVGRAREDRLRAAMPFSVPTPAAHADAHRERNERWGSGEVSPLMGGGYTVVLQRAHEDLEDARRRRAVAERERELYFMEPEDEFVRGEETCDARTSNRNRMERTSAGMALRGWTGDSARRRNGFGESSGEKDDAQSVLPLPRGYATATSDSGSGYSVKTTLPGSIEAHSTGGSTAGAGSHARGKRFPGDGARRGGGYGAQLALIGAGTASKTQPFHNRPRSTSGPGAS